MVGTAYRTRASSFASLLQIATLALVLFGIPAFVRITGAAMSQGLIPPAAAKWIWASGSAPLVGVFIFSMALQQGLIAKLLSVKIAVALGEVSFSIYLTHQVLIRALTNNHTLSAFGTMPQQFAAYLAIILILSFALCTFFEKPCRRNIVSKFDAIGPATRTFRMKCRTMSQMGCWFEV